MQQPRVYHNNNFTMQQAGSETQFPWFNQNINYRDTSAYANHRMAGIHLQALPRPFNAPISPNQNPINWSPPLYPPQMAPISPLIPILSPPPQQEPAGILQTDEPPIIPCPSPPQSQHAPNLTGPMNNRAPEPMLYANGANDGAPRPNSNGPNWTFRNQSQPRCPFLSSDRGRRIVTSNLQTMYHNQYPHTSGNIHYIRPAYAPHETLWYRQQNNQEMHRRHMIHPANVEGMTVTNPHLHHHNNNIRLYGPNNQAPNMVYCLSCDQQHPNTHRRARAFMCPAPAVSFYNFMYINIFALFLSVISL